MTHDLSTRRPAPTRALLVVCVLAAVLGPAAAPQAVQGAPATFPTEISAEDPAGDVVVDGDFEPLLGSGEVHDAADLTGVSGAVTPSDYTIRVTTVGPLTGASDLLFLTTEVLYEVTWWTVTRRGRIAEIPENIRLTVAAEGVTIENNSLPPRCRNAADFAVAAGPAADSGGGLVTITVPRTCSKGTYGVPIGVADIRVTSEGFGPGGTTASSYSDDAEVLGIARLAPGSR